VAGAAVLGGRDAAAGIEVVAGEIRARKSFFFLSDAQMIVAMGNHIRGRRLTETVVHTFPVQEAKLVVNGVPTALEESTPVKVETPAWVHGPCGAYYFPEPATVLLVTETRSPCFEDVGNPPPEKQPEVPARKFVSILFEHGEDPRDGGYVWVHWPTASLDQTPSLAEEFRVRARHGTSESGHMLEFGSFLGLVFFESGELEGWTADCPCFLVARKDDKTARLAAYEPSFTDCRLTVHAPLPLDDSTLAGTVQSDGCTVVIQQD
jgi:hypothetical protein